MKSNPQITTENIEDVFVELYGEKYTHLYHFFSKQSPVNKYYTYWISQVFLEYENKTGKCGAWMPLKILKQQLIPSIIKNETSLFRLLNKMKSSHIVDKKTEVVTYQNTPPGKTKEDTFYRFSDIAFLGRMSDEEANRVRASLSDKSSFWDALQKMQRKLEVAIDILHDLGVSDPESEIDKRLQNISEKKED